MWTIHVSTSTTNREKTYDQRYYSTGRLRSAQDSARLITFSLGFTYTFSLCPFEQSASMEQEFAAIDLQCVAIDPKFAEETANMAS
jgi:hypothetical protein